jgi:hypothetical protein
VKDQRSAHLATVLPAIEEVIAEALGPPEEGVLAELVEVTVLAPTARHIVVPGPSATTVGTTRPPVQMTTFGDALESLVEYRFQCALSDRELADWADGAPQRAIVSRKVDEWARAVRHRREADLLAELRAPCPTLGSDAPLSVAAISASIAAHIGEARTVNLVVERGTLADKHVGRHLRGGAVLEVDPGTLPDVVGLLVRPDRANIHRAFGLTFGFVPADGHIVLVLRERSLLKVDTGGAPPQHVGVALRKASAGRVQPARTASASSTVNRPS